MLNKPHLDMIETTSQLLAGEKFPANQQCELIFGPNSKVCPFTVTVSTFKSNEISKNMHLSHFHYYVPLQVSIFGQEVDQVSEWNDTRKQQILIRIQI